MLQCIQNPSGHCPCSLARVACVDAQGVSHGGMRSCSQCYDQCECGSEYDTSKQAEAGASKGGGRPPLQQGDPRDHPSGGQSDEPEYLGEALSKTPRRTITDLYAAIGLDVEVVHGALPTPLYREFTNNPNNMLILVGFARGGGLLH